MPKKDLKKTKAKTVTVKGTITLSQKDAINSLVGILGSNEQDVVGKVIIENRRLSTIFFLISKQSSKKVIISP